MNKEDKVILKAFGEKIRLYRKDKGVSQEELGNMAGLDRTYIGSVERGERNISLVNIHRIANALSVKVRELIESND